MTKSSKDSTIHYDLEERTARFGEDVIAFLREVPRDALTTPLVSQLVRSATSIGANYMEANAASSKKDFQNKIALCRKEANETKHWLRMMAKARPELRDACRRLWSEAHELSLIFGRITATIRRTRAATIGEFKINSKFEIENSKFI